MRVFLVMGSLVKTPHPWSLERRRTMAGRVRSSGIEKQDSARRCGIITHNRATHMSRTAVGAREIVQAWGRILGGHRPNLSIEITKECPLRCPGCYAYGDEHLGGNGVTLRGLADYKGDELVVALHGGHRRAQAAARVDRRRRAAGALQGARTRSCRSWPSAACTRRSSRAPCGRFRRNGSGCAACRSSCRSTACSRSTTSAASRPPTSASSSTSKGTRSRCTAP